MRRIALCCGLLLMSATAVVNAGEGPSPIGKDFAINFFEKVVESKKDSSVITSPLGVSFVLGMLTGGANGTTEEEINKVLDVKNSTVLADYHHGLLTTLPTLDEKTEFGIANAIILNSAGGYSFLPTYTQLMKDRYEALMESLDFGDRSTLDYINGWCRENTHGMIPKVLDELTPDMVSVLMNALYFKGIWSQTFDPEQTTRDYFFAANGENDEIAMMHADGTYPYASNDIFKTVRLDYGNGSYSMYVMLPQWGRSIREVLAKMKETDWMAAPKPTDDLRLSLPQFSSQSDFSLVEILKALGITSMFSPFEADFSRMMDLATVGNLYVSLFKQVAKIEVDENGTKAAAVTVAAIEKTSIDGYEFCANHPFLYAIVENTTSTVCFMGQFTGVGTDASAKPFATGVQEVPTGLHSETSPAYDLSGRKATTPLPQSIYVRNGKRFLKK